MSGFTDTEREHIRKTLITAGREHFSKFGIDRTRIKDLTDKAGIATSTFYQFFDSKEALYLTVLHREQQRVSEGFDDAIADNPNLHAEVTAGFEYFFSELESNRLYYNLIVMDDIQQLFSRADDSELESFYEAQQKTFRPHIQRWITADEFRVDDPAELFDVFRLLAFVVVGKERFKRVDAEASGLDTAHETLMKTIVHGLFVD